MSDLTVPEEDWLALKDCSIHMDLTEIVQTGRKLVKSQSKELCRGFLILNEEILVKASEGELVGHLRNCMKKEIKKEKKVEENVIERIRKGCIEEKEVLDYPEKVCIEEGNHSIETN